MKKRIAINGLGRIGRKLTHLIMRSEKYELVAINDIMPIDMAVYFLKYDSTYGKSDWEIAVKDNKICIEDKEIYYSSSPEIENLVWGELNIDIAVNCSGTHKSKPQLSQYLELGIPKVILSSPPDSDDIPIIILGYNEDVITSHKILSSASCTTYCVAPVLDIFHRLYGIDYANFTTIHCYTSDQNLQDSYHQDYRRSRAAGVNIIPTTTSATRVIKRIFPELQHNVTGSSFRVPVINGSVTEFIIELTSIPKIEDVYDMIKRKSSTTYQSVISYTEDNLVSTDVIGCPYAALIDMNSIEIVDNKVKLTAFYDNEAGYTHQLLRLIDAID